MQGSAPLASTLFEGHLGTHEVSLNLIPMEHSEAQSGASWVSLPISSALSPERMGCMSLRVHVFKQDVGSWRVPFRA